MKLKLQESFLEWKKKKEKGTIKDRIIRYARILEKYLS